ncbi:MAG: hypothetical protein OCC49_00805 [Fibrobacterales bacterium]
MKHILLLISILISISFSFDGDRQGFLIGIGTGAVANTFVKLDIQENENERSMSSTPYIPSKIGFAWSNTQAVLLYGAGFQTTFAHNGQTTFTYTSLNYQQWSNSDSQSNFWFAGVGPLINSYDSYIIKGVTPADPDYGIALNAGYGRELISHFSFEINVILGYIKSGELSPKQQIYAGLAMSVNLLGY